MQMKLFDVTGKSKSKITLPDEMFACKPNSVLLAQAVRVFLANQHQKTVKVKSRGEVRGSRRKIWRQKGTGRARHGDRYAPIFVGGGIAHGPTGDDSSKLRLSKKMRRKALFLALSLKVKNNQTILVDGLEKLEPKTKIVNSTLRNLSEKEKNQSKKTSVIVSDNSENFVRGARNIKGLTLLSPDKLNAYEIINSGFLLIMKDSLEKMKQTFLDKKSKITKSSPKLEGKKAKKDNKAPKTSERNKIRESIDKNTKKPK